MRRLLVLGALAWTVRWLALELASLYGHLRGRGPAPLDSPRAPGHMPGPFD